jgi:hypothetical protein
MFRPRALYPLTFVLFLIDSSAANAQPPRITVGPNVHVSAALPNDPHFEMWLAADPANADRLIACSMLWPNDWHTSEVVTYASLDRGKNWTPTLRTRGDRGRPSWDPACAYGPNGIAYVVSENIDSAFKSYDRIDRSTDGGRTWDPSPTRFKHGERTFISVDNTNGPRRGWIYFYGAGSVCLPGVKCANSGALFFRASGDGGRTIVSEQAIPTSGHDYPIGYGQGVVLADGSVLAPLGEWKGSNVEGEAFRAPKFERSQDSRWANGLLKVFRSNADRPNWPPSTEVFDIGDWFLQRESNGSYLPHLAVDLTSGPFKGRVYAIWPDQRSGRAEVYLAHSDDAGKTWSRARTVNDDRPWSNGQGPDPIHGMVAANKDGVVGVMWLDRRDHPDNLGWTVRFRASLDGGETFTPSVQVSEAPYDPARTDPMPLIEIGGWENAAGQVNLGVHNFHFNAGHTVGFAADGTFHALWVGNSTRVAQLWTASISITGSVLKNGGSDLASLVDVSSRVRFMASNRNWQRTTGVVEADVVLENMSKDTIRAPLKMRLLDLSSELGVPRVANADAGGTGEGAVWDVTSLVGGGVLLPGQRTRPKRIQFSMTDMATLRPSALSARTGLAVFNVKILAGSVARAAAKDSTAK